MTRKKVAAFTASLGFEYFIIGVIVINAIILGLETSGPLRAAYGGLFELGNNLALMVFILEAMAKIYGVWPEPGKYFRDGWNLFDFTVIALSLLPAAGTFAMIARLARLLRVARLISVSPELRLIVATLIKSIPSMANIILLLLVIFYVYGIAGYYLFHEADPAHWGDLGVAMLTLFQVVTLEGWADILNEAMKERPFAWVYFISFIVLATFIVVNLFVAVALNNLEEAKVEQLKELRKDIEQGEIAQELREIMDRLASIEARLTSGEKGGASPKG